MAQRTSLGNRRKASFWHFIPPYARVRARGQRRAFRRGRPICRRRTRLRDEITEPSGGFNVKTTLARVRPGSNAAVL